MPPVGFENTISAGGRPHIYALDRAATRTGNHVFTALKIVQIYIKTIYNELRVSLLL